MTGEMKLRQNLKPTTKRRNKEKKKEFKDKRSWKQNERQKKDPWNWEQKNRPRQHLQMTLLMLYYKLLLWYYLVKFFFFTISQVLKMTQKVSWFKIAKKNSSNWRKICSAFLESIQTLTIFFLYSFPKICWEFIWIFAPKIQNFTSSIWPVFGR